MSEKYELVYFNGRGRAEVARLLFACKGVDFKDTRLEYERWASYKEEQNLPYGLPCLKVGDKTIIQSLAITNYLAREFGLYGKNAYDQALIDQVGQCFHDIAVKLPMFEKDEQKKKEILDKLFSETYPKLLKNIEDKFLKGEKDCAQFIVGDISVADIGLMVMFEVMEASRKDSITKDYPKIAALAEKVRSQPRIAKYLKERPVTEF